MFSQYRLPCKYGAIFQISILDKLDTELHFLTHGIAIANQGRL